MILAWLVVEVSPGDDLTGMLLYPFSLVLIGVVESLFFPFTAILLFGLKKVFLTTVFLLLDWVGRSKLKVFGVVFRVGENMSWDFSDYWFESRLIRAFILDPAYNMSSVTFLVLESYIKFILGEVTIFEDFGDLASTLVFSA